MAVNRSGRLNGVFRERGEMVVRLTAKQRRERDNERALQAALLAERSEKARTVLVGKRVSVVDLLDKKRKYGFIAEVRSDGYAVVKCEWLPGEWAETGFSINDPSEAVAVFGLAFVDHVEMEFAPPYYYQVSYLDHAKWETRSVTVYGHAEDEVLKSFVHLMAGREGLYTIRGVLCVS